MDISVHDFWGQRATVDTPSPVEPTEPTKAPFEPIRTRIPKRKRVDESLHDLGPCDSCRARRVKWCVDLFRTRSPSRAQTFCSHSLRDDPVDASCAECRKRHTECLSVGGSVKKSWARIAQPPKPGPTRLAVEAGPSTASTSSTALTVSPSELSAEARLHIAEENSAILSSLLYTFYELASQGFGVLWWPTLRDLFERAGRDLHRLEPAIQVSLLAAEGFDR